MFTVSKEPCLAPARSPGLLGLTFVSCLDLGDAQGSSSFLFFTKVSSYGTEMFLWPQVCAGQSNVNSSHIPAPISPSQLSHPIAVCPPHAAPWQCPAGLPPSLAGECQGPAGGTGTAACPPVPADPGAAGLGHCVALSHRGHCVQGEVANCSAAMSRAAVLEAPGAALLSGPAAAGTWGCSCAGDILVLAAGLRDQQGTELPLPEVTLASSWDKHSLALASSFVLLWRSGGTWTGYFAGIILTLRLLPSWDSCPLCLLPSPVGCGEMGLPESLCPCPDPGVGARMVWAQRACWFGGGTPRGAVPVSSCALPLNSSMGCGAIPVCPVFTWWQPIQLSYKCLVLFSLNRV